MKSRSMGLAAACVAAIAAHSGCSLLYDPDDLALQGDAGGGQDADRADARPDAGPPGIDEYEPRAVFEGTGSSGEAIPLVIRGAGFAQDLVVEPGSDLVSIDEVVVSQPGDLAAAAIRVAVEPELERGRVEEIELAISQDGFSETLVLEVVGLAELPLAGEVQVDEETFDARYAEITTEDDTTLTGEHAARLVATGSITVSHDIDASGGLGGRRAPGAGGCGGGATTSPGTCSGGGGGASSAGAGGGGGGHAAEGDEGTGAADDRGEGGAKSGSAMLVPLGGEDGSRGHGGGGGHAGTLGAAGVGGGGGGVIELSSWGDVRIDARLLADGAEGGAAGGVTCGGGGGGGSGGALLIRAGGALTAAGGSVLARGGAGGGGNCESPGGDGADGRIRIDATGRNLPGDLTVEGAAVRGPMWLDPPPAIVRRAEREVEFVGEPGFEYALEIGGEIADRRSPGVGGTGSLSGELAPGMNEVCLLVPSDFPQDRPESRNCRRVAFVP